MGLKRYNIELDNPRGGKLFTGNKLSRRLRVYLEGNEVMRPQYDAGKFFFFVMIDSKTALKFLYYKGIPRNERMGEVAKVARIQNLLSKHGVAYPCSEEVVQVAVKSTGKDKLSLYYGYVTEAHPDAHAQQCLHEQYDNMKFLQSFHTACMKENVWRQGLVRELQRRKNYSINESGDVVFVDIDPKFYTTQCDGYLCEQIQENAQFPYKRRNLQYQSIEDLGLRGIRNTAHRMNVMRFSGFGSRSVLDIGCNLGVFCKMAKDYGASRCVGIDHRKETIQVARKYMSDSECDVELFTYNVNDGVDALTQLIGDEQFDIVLALSVLKHINNEALFDIINWYARKKCWIEGHAKQSKEDVRQLLENNLTHKEIRFLGYTKDRGKRANFEVIK